MWLSLTGKKKKQFLRNSSYQNVAVYQEAVTVESNPTQPFVVNNDTELVGMFYGYMN